MTNFICMSILNIYIYMYTYGYIYREKERERERERKTERDVYIYIYIYVLTRAPGVLFGVLFTQDDPTTIFRVRLFILTP